MDELLTEIGATSVTAIDCRFAAEVDTTRLDCSSRDLVKSLLNVLLAIFVLNRKKKNHINVNTKHR